MGGLVIIFILWSFVPRERLIVLIKEVFSYMQIFLKTNQQQRQVFRYEIFEQLRNLQYKYTCVSNLGACYLLCFIYILFTFCFLCKKYYASYLSVNLEFRYHAVHLIQSFLNLDFKSKPLRRSPNLSTIFKISKEIAKNSKHFNNFFCGT